MGKKIFKIPKKKSRVGSMSRQRHGNEGSSPRVAVEAVMTDKKEGATD